MPDAADFEDRSGRFKALMRRYWASRARVSSLQGPLTRKVVLTYQRLHNLAQFLTDWTNYTALGNGSSDLRYRPSVPATLYGNTTVQGSWVDIKNMTERSNTHGRIINNVSLAFPHPGVAAAAQDPRNNIIQPSEFSVRCGARKYRRDLVDDTIGSRSV